MEAKANEANRPGAPPYGLVNSTEQTSSSNSHSAPSHTINMEQTTRPPAMFITARTSVYGPIPVETECPHCEAHIVTHIDRIAGVLPWLIFGACVILGFFLFLVPWCFCCLPFFTDQCLDVLHSCPCCKRHLGRYSRM